LAGEEEERSARGEGGGETVQPGRPERPRLRRRPLGYKRADVDEALEARDGELAELRQDIAALWLAFAQHDRMLRALTGEAPPPPSGTEPKRRETPETAAPSMPLETEAASIGAQLSELDEVLAAIEMATKTLERTYSEEIDTADEPTAAEDGDSDPPATEAEDPGRG